MQFLLGGGGVGGRDRLMFVDEVVLLRGSSFLSLALESDLERLFDLEVTSSAFSFAACLDE